ncbi:hypothetical protein EUGRSUZ_K00401 [Eucalyptus grandis]|uniref:Uncharacterized protein n=2 Tax=Eucalyptus grandis TaxID=71139 RepID=A0ACC3IRJ8_EUCGR|nr:hypothetical protein EUGRSUZ_K00401 [Eucalyptus grandis]
MGGSRHLSFLHFMPLSLSLSPHQIPSPVADWSEGDRGGIGWRDMTATMEEDETRANAGGDLFCPGEIVGEERPKKRNVYLGGGVKHLKETEERGGGREKKTDVKVNVILLRNVVSFEEWTWASQDNTGGSNRKASSNLFLIKKILNCIQPA